MRGAEGAAAERRVSGGVDDHRVDGEELGAVGSSREIELVAPLEGIGGGRWGDRDDVVGGAGGEEERQHGGADYLTPLPPLLEGRGGADLE